MALLGVAAVVLAAGYNRSQADPGNELLPDLVTLRPPELRMPPHPKRDLLLLSNEIGNRGLGPLQLRPSTSIAECDSDGDPNDDREAGQTIFSTPATRACPVTSTGPMTPRRAHAWPAA